MKSISDWLNSSFIVGLYIFPLSLTFLPNIFAVSWGEATSKSFLNFLAASLSYLRESFVKDSVRYSVALSFNFFNISPMPNFSFTISLMSSNTVWLIFPK